MQPATVTEVAPDTLAISTFIPEFDLSFNQFLVKGDEPLLLHKHARPVSQHPGSTCAFVIDEDLVARFRHAIVEYDGGPFAHYLLYTPNTQNILEGLAALNPQTLLSMHGSAWTGDSAAAIRSIADILKNVLGT